MFQHVLLKRFIFDHSKLKTLMQFIVELDLGEILCPASKTGFGYSEKLLLGTLRLHFCNQDHELVPNNFELGNTSDTMLSIKPNGSGELVKPNRILNI